MTHHLLLKLKNREERDSFIQESIPKLERFLPSDIGISDVKIIPNAADREENMDVLILLEMEDADVLNRYLDSEIHRDFIRFAGPKVSEKITFDMA